MIGDQRPQKKIFFKKKCRNAGKRRAALDAVCKHACVHASSTFARDAPAWRHARQCRAWCNSSNGVHKFFQEVTLCCLRTKPAGRQYKPSAKARSAPHGPLSRRVPPTGAPAGVRVVVRRPPLTVPRAATDPGFEHRTMQGPQIIVSDKKFLMLIAAAKSQLGSHLSALVKHNNIIHHLQAQR